MADGSTPVALPAIPFPTGQTTGQLYNWATSTSASLRRYLQILGSGTVDITALQGDVTELQGQVLAMQDQIADMGDELFTPQKAFELDLVTRSDAVFGSFAELRNRLQTRLEQNADAAMQAAIQAAKANTGVRTTVRVMNEQNIALAERIDEVTADLGVTNGNVVQLTQTVADGDSALATQITDVSSAVAGNTASIAILTSSVNGVLTRFAIALNSQGEIIGSIQLDGSPAGSAFTVNADSFKVGKAGTSGGTAINAFAIDVVNGVPQIALRGQVIADGTILARAIAAGAITADKISVNSLKAVSSFFDDMTCSGIQRSQNGKMVIDWTNNRRWIDA